jgi:hypothetical protein
MKPLPKDVGSTDEDSLRAFESQFENEDLTQDLDGYYVSQRTVDL